ncbi:XRE family transcriptional regulator [Paracoccus siganidrum]|uniref:ImmA/IrrE family metallo-endopeptidase n=1 Tax=Paracoccus siganidrum TaxID=1276757 RepID=A0A419A9G9_9RHOB|nr:XRE family transcriptional regulator [Paracoccus siganidrum]RJL18880.1 ImmA/IrrE family metallo-endopeptidase [Paracoccus siganidrum]RMC30508.1 DNA-binding protein [Paracoccus siganidrum]
MIYSEKQYGISVAELAKLKGALARSEGKDFGQGWIRNVEIEGLRSVISDLEADISYYDLLNSGQVTFSKSFSLETLPSAMIQARIAAGMSQGDLAAALGIKPHLLRQYEDTGYLGVPLSRMIEICRVLNVHVSVSFELGQGPHSAVHCWESVEELIWQQFPVEEMARRGWFVAPEGADLVQCARSYFMDAAGPNFVTANHRKKSCAAGLPDEYALLAWQARVLELARTQKADTAEFTRDTSWLPDLAALAGRAEGSRQVRDLLAAKGIICVMEPNLPGVHLDGAAMLGEGGCPVIAMTLRHDRLDSFWFTLFHQLGHVFLHLFDGLRFDFFDAEEGRRSDAIERQAEQFALTNLMPGADWESCRSRRTPSAEAVRSDAERLGIHAAIIAGRIRRERNDYTILSDLVGPGLVRAGGTDPASREI